MTRLLKHLRILFVNIFFNCYLAAPRPTLGHYRGDSLTHPMLITAYYIFDSGVTGSLVARLGPSARPCAQWGLNQEPSDSYYSALTHQATLPYIVPCLQILLKQNHEVEKGNGNEPILNYIKKLGNHPSIEQIKSKKEQLFTFNYVSYE